jgi:hypothetical protein
MAFVKSLTEIITNQLITIATLDIRYLTRVIWLGLCQFDHINWIIIVLFSTITMNELLNSTQTKNMNEKSNKKCSVHEKLQMMTDEHKQKQTGSYII